VRSPASARPRTRSGEHGPGGIRLRPGVSLVPSRWRPARPGRPHLRIHHRRLPTHAVRTVRRLRQTPTGAARRHARGDGHAGGGARTPVRARSPHAGGRPQPATLSTHRETRPPPGTGVGRGIACAGQRDAGRGRRSGTRPGTPQPVAGEPSHPGPPARARGYRGPGVRSVARVDEPDRGKRGRPVRGPDPADARIAAGLHPAVLPAERRPLHARREQLGRGAAGSGGGGGDAARQGASARRKIWTCGFTYGR